MNFKDLVNQLQTLNKEAVIRLSDPRKDPNARRIIYSSRDAGKLKLPVGYTYNNLIGIVPTTNVPGATALAVAGLDKADASKLLPLKSSLPDISDSNNIQLLAWELMKLNSDKRVGIDFPNVVPNSKNIYLNSATGLVLPFGFKYDCASGSLVNSRISAPLKKQKDGIHVFTDDTSVDIELSDDGVYDNSTSGRVKKTGKKVVKSITDIFDKNRKILGAFTTALLDPSNPNNIENRPKQKKK